jgi:hypothetical protein
MTSHDEATNDEETLVASMVGKTIAAARWYEDSPTDSWSGHEECEITFTDGTAVRFGAWGYDSWGATIDEVCREGEHRWVSTGSRSPALRPPYCGVCFKRQPAMVEP